MSAFVALVSSPAVLRCSDIELHNFGVLDQKNGPSSFRRLPSHVYSDASGIAMYNSGFCPFLSFLSTECPREILV